MASIYFYIGLSFIFMHEMDAIRCKEWRIFPLLSYLDDQKGFIVFMFAHIPLFSILLYYLNQPDNEGIVTGMNYFLIIHLGLHLLFLMHPKNEFKDWISWSIIVGAAIFGAIDLMI